MNTGESTADATASSGEGGNVDDEGVPAPQRNATVKETQSSSNGYGAAITGYLSETASWGILETRKITTNGLGLQNLSLFGLDSQIVGVQIPQFRGSSEKSHDESSGDVAQQPKTNDGNATPATLVRKEEGNDDVDATAHISDTELAKQIQKFSTLTSYEQVLGLPMWASFEHKNTKAGDQDLKVLNARVFQIDSAGSLLKSAPRGSAAHKQASVCSNCGEKFLGGGRFKYTCRHCGEYICSKCSKTLMPIHKFGLHDPVQVCDNCKNIIEGETAAEKQEWRQRRAVHLTQGQLVPYFTTAEDSGTAKLLRVCDAVVSVARVVPIGAEVNLALSTVGMLRKHGFSALGSLIYRNEIAQSIVALRTHVLEESGTDTKKLAFAAYYMMTRMRYERGCQPKLEWDKHENSKLVHPYLLDQIIQLAPLPLKIMYKSYLLDMQRLAQHLTLRRSFEANGNDGQPVHSNFRLICAEVEAWLNHPVYALFAEEPGSTAPETADGRKSKTETRSPVNRKKRKGNGHKRPEAYFTDKPMAILAIRGTKSPTDCLTDLRFELKNILDVAKNCSNEATNDHLSSSFPPVECAEHILKAAKCNTTMCRFTDFSSILTSTLLQQFWTFGSSTSSDDSSKLERTGTELEVQRSESGEIGLVHEGMAMAAFNILSETGLALLKLHDSGYRIILTGHSLGAGTAALLTALMQWKIPGARCVAYAPPPCMDKMLATYSKDFVTSVVLRDDPIPRCSIANLVELFRKLDESEEWQGHFESDLQAFKARAKTLWAPQHRCSDITKVERTEIDANADEKEVATTSTKMDTIMEKEPEPQISEENTSYIASVGTGISRTIGLGRLVGRYSKSDADHEDATKKAEDAASLNGNGEDLIPKEQVHELDKIALASGEGIESGDVNARKNENDREMKGSLGSRFSDLMNWQRKEDGASPNEIVQSDQIIARRRSLKGTAGRVQLPGVIVHLSFQHGQVEAFEVRDVETFPDLNEINLYFSALDDHKGGNYIEALETVRWQRAATQRPAVVHPQLSERHLRRQPLTSQNEKE